MEDRIRSRMYLRQSTDAASPQQSTVLEAAPHCTFSMHSYTENVPAQRPVHVPWALANVLHFFADTEDAAPLSRYNKLAERFAPNGQWDGAYGYIAMRQLRSCVVQLMANPASRRAVVSMGEAYPQNINRPACWSFLQLLIQDDELHLSVYQRSLHLHNVMPYDCVVLTNILNWAAWRIGVRVGALHWTIGSLHTGIGARSIDGQPLSLMLPPAVLDDRKECWQWLLYPESAQPEWAEMLC